MAPTYFIQMSGVPGSGKSSLAKELAEKLAAVVLDHDDTKSAILKSGVAESEAGAASYEVVKALSARMVEHGRSVIIDSPCLYRELLDHGVHTAERHGARYKYIECQLRDLDELDRRLRSRIPKPSQVHHLDQGLAMPGQRPVLQEILLLSGLIVLVVPVRVRW